MEHIKINELLLNTAFSCMACDGYIDPREVELIKSLHDDKKLFGDIDLFDEIEKHRMLINEDSGKYLRNYFKQLTSAELTEQNELKIIEVAMETIKVDTEIKYSEIKFFKIIRSKLKIANEVILEMFPDFEEYLEQDIISESYVAKLQNDFFDNHSLPVFELIKATVGDS
jgi:hypothetical protein